MKDKIVKESEQKMEKTLAVLKEEFHKIRTGRATASILDNVKIDYYGQSTAVSQVGTISVPDARTITIAPWEVTLIAAIEKAIRASDLGLNPLNDGKVIRLPIPPLSEDRRKEFVKIAKKYTEDAKVAIRNIRRDENERVKKMKKDGEIPEDMEKKILDEIQKTTDNFIKEADVMLSKKEAEIMEV